MLTRSHSFLVAATSTAFVLSASAAMATNYQVYLIGGQSNGSGRGDASQLSGSLAKPQTDVRFYWHRTQKAENAGTLPEDQWIDLAPGSGHGKTAPVYPKEFGCEISFGRSMADADHKSHIAIIKYTHGGTNLNNNWATNGPQYTAFVATVQAGLKALSASGDTYELRGMLWDQGENDTNTLANANKYEANLTALVSRIRKDIAGDTMLPFVIGGLSNSQDK